YALALPRGLEVEQRGVRGRHGEVGRDLVPAVVGDVGELADRGEVRAPVDGRGEAQPEVVRLGAGCEPGPGGQGVADALIGDRRDVEADAVTLAVAPGDQRGLRTAVGLVGR